MADTDQNWRDDFDRRLADAADYGSNGNDDSTGPQTQDRGPHQCRHRPRLTLGENEK